MRSGETPLLRSLRRFALSLFVVAGLALGAGAAQGQGDETEAWRPGLYETFISMSDISTADWTLDYSSFTEGSTFKNKVYRRELGVYLCKAAYDQSYTSELWGDTWRWTGSGQFVYWGYVYLEAGKSYRFNVSGNKYNFLQVTDLVTNEKKKLLDGSWSQWSACTSSEYVPGMTGWYSIEARIQGSGLYYKGTNGGGYSSDGGKTWNLLYDSGDGSLLRTAGPALVIKASGRVADSKQVIDLSFASSDLPRTLAVVWGATRGGESTNAWANAQVIGTVAAGATTATYTMPESWGTADNLVARFCFVPSETVQPEWSNTYYWHDLSAPAFADVAADGSGGDTIKVTGRVESFTGDSCAVKVLVGTSSDALTEWTDATTTLTEAGDFSFTLRADVANARAITPGTTCYVQVEATANDQTARSQVAGVKTLCKANWALATASVSRNVVTFWGRLDPVGMSEAGQVPVTLWVGTENSAAKLAQVGEAITVGGTASFAITNTFEKGGTYYWQFRAANASAGGTSNLVVSSSVKSVATQDLTIYTWKGGAEGAWEDENNWEASPAVGSFGYPSTSDATAVFAEGTTATATLSSASALTISKVVITNSNVDVTLKKTAGSNGKLTVGSFAPTGAGSVLTLDGLTLQIPSGASVGENFTLSLVNGASVDHPGSAPTFENKGGRILLSAGTTFYGQIYKMSNGSLTSISNATLKFYHYVYWDGKDEKANTIRFEGTSPSLTAAGGGNGHQAFAPWTEGSVLNLDFVLPKSGYETAPLRYSADNIIMGKGENSKSGVAYVNVIANEKVKVAEGATIPLVSWTSKGIDTNVVVKGTMPTKKTKLVYGGESVVTTIDVDVQMNPGVIIFLR